eukprot:RCo037695
MAVKVNIGELTLLGKHPPASSGEGTRAEENGIIFRPLTWEDVPELASLQRHLFPVCYNEAFYQSLFAADVRAVLACHNNQIVGVATGRTHPPRSCNEFESDAYIITLGVHQQYRRLHLGSQLLMRLHRMLEDSGCPAVFLHCKADNYAAISFYQRHGYTIARALTNYYYIDNAYHDAYVLRRKL